MARCSICEKKLNLNEDKFQLDSNTSDSICGECFGRIPMLSEDLLQNEETFEQAKGEAADSFITSGCPMIGVKKVVDYLESKRNEYKIAYGLKNHLVTTGYQFDGYQIERYLGIVSGQSVLGTGFFTDLSSSFDDLLGTESPILIEKMELARENALQRMTTRSIQRGGNAIIGIDFDITILGGNMISITATGTSVVVK